MCRLEDQIVKHCAPTLAGLKTGNVFGVSFDDKMALFNEIRDINLRLSGKGVRLMPISTNNGRALIYVYRPSALLSDLTDTTATRILIERGYRTDQSIGKTMSLLFKKLKTDKEFPHEIGLFLGYPPNDVRCFIEEKQKSRVNESYRVLTDEAVDKGSKDPGNDVRFSSGRGQSIALNNSDVINPENLTGNNEKDPEIVSGHAAKDKVVENYDPLAGYCENKRSVGCDVCKRCKKVGCWKVYNDVERAEKSFAMFKKCERIYYKKWLEGASIEKLTVRVS